eukprot:scaffold266193_cov40-Tisochrysis_lutea.AAC.1
MSRSLRAVETQWVRCVAPPGRMAAQMRDWAALTEVARTVCDAGLANVVQVDVQPYKPLGTSADRARGRD